jgi:hypothetical protein
MEVLRKIRSLLHEQGMTIEGARRVLAGGAMPAKEVPAPKAQAAEGLPADVAALLRDALKELREIRALLTPNSSKESFS